MTNGSRSGDFSPIQLTVKGVSIQIREGTDSTSAPVGVGANTVISSARLSSNDAETATADSTRKLKVTAQKKHLNAIRLAPGDTGDPDPFADVIDWSYCSFVVNPENVTIPGDEQIFQRELYLFNVLVAIEWVPDQPTLQLLKTTFRRASDFLFDVTDGWMAFGRVIFGGPELMKAADIQIMASTRMLPRSWVGGMHTHKEYKQDQKYQPIRLGRGIWNDIRRGIISWEEPEAYRLIIHEWGHYALNLRDEYLETRRLNSPTISTSPTMVSAGSLISATQLKVAPPQITVVTLNVPATSDSIMASTEGTSELVSDQWEDLSKFYPEIPPDRPPDSVRPGPDRLPGEKLPYFRLTQSLSDDMAKSLADYQQLKLVSGQSSATATNRIDLPSDFPLDQCWLYVLKGVNGDQFAPSSIIAQGTLESRSNEIAFQLLGVEEHDSIIAVGTRRGQLPVVKRAEVFKDTPLEWVDARPPLFPIIDVVPEEIKPNSPRANVRVRLNFLGVPERDIVLPEQVWIFPLGQAPGNCEAPYDPRVAMSQLSQYPWILESNPIDISTLDGHVVVRWPDNSWLISTFSQGGDGPNSSRPFPANPMNAGSSDGSALLLMYKDGKKPKERNDTKVVTSIVYGFSLRTGAGTKQADRSYIFSVASNNALPPFNPSLLLYYDTISEAEQYTLPEGDLRICRWINDKGWVPIPTYIPAGFRFAIAPVDQTSGGTLTDTELPDSKARIEYYKVAWVSLDS